MWDRRPSFPVPRAEGSPSSGGESGEPDQTSNRTIRYLPRRSSASTRSPSSSAATSVGSNGTHEPRIVDLDVLEAAADEVRLELTSDRLDLGQLRHQPIVSSTIGASAVRGFARRARTPRAPRRLGTLPRRRLVAGVHLGKQFAGGDRVAALLQADDADGVVDHVLLRAPSRAEAERRRYRCRSRPSARTKPVARRLDLVRRRRRAAARSSLGSPPCARSSARTWRAPVPSASAASARASALGLVDAEIGEREQMSARVEDKLREVGRPFAAQRRDRLADLERVADRVARAAGPCR